MVLFKITYTRSIPGILGSYKSSETLKAEIEKSEFI